jgi:hypothetical protein
MNEDKNTPDEFPHRNQIWRMAQERLAEQKEALNQIEAAKHSRDNGRGRQGPKTGHTVEITKLAIVTGRNKVPVCPDEVEHLAQLGCNDNEISKYFGITPDSLRRNFELYLVRGRHNLRVSLRQAQLRVAIEGNPTMLIWLGKNMLSQNDQGQANDDNRPLPWTDEIDDDVIDADEIEMVDDEESV